MLKSKVQNAGVFTRKGGYTLISLRVYLSWDCLAKMNKINAMKILTPSSWKDYALLDSGDGEKLERFGKYGLIRPEPQAIWPKVLSNKDWQSLVTARFDREQKDKFRVVDEVKGGWSRSAEMPESWNVSYHFKELNIQLRLALTGFGHVGIFPEQGNNWNYIYEAIMGTRGSNAKVLNLFAYTGAASIVARFAGADVVHVDASRPGINWANQNMQLNGLKDIRWVHEDALKFVRREVGRGNKYRGIIMDPPPYGRGPAGEKWTLQEKLNELVQMAGQLLDDKDSFLVLSMYAVGLSALVGLNVVKSHFSREDVEFGEFSLRPKQGHDLPMGTFVRFRR
jgi:23S rRNA (cytosine1962-C5)-methyltransferase